MAVERVTKQEAASATAVWISGNWHTPLTILVLDDHGVTWAIPKPAYDAILLKGAISDARAGLPELR